MSGDYRYYQDRVDLKEKIRNEAAMDRERDQMYAKREEMLIYILKLETSLKKPLAETILAVLKQMPSDIAPEHLAKMIEKQVQAWQAIP